MQQAIHYDEFNTLLKFDKEMICFMCLFRL